MTAEDTVFTWEDGLRSSVGHRQVEVNARGTIHIDSAFRLSLAKIGSCKESLRPARGCTQTEPCLPSPAAGRATSSFSQMAEEGSAETAGGEDLEHAPVPTRPRECQQSSGDLVWRGTAVDRSIRRSAPSSARWQPPTHCGAHRGFMASCACSVSTCQNAPCRVSWNSTPIGLRRHGRRFSATTSRQRRRWISSRCQR
jgi:hypothetical protein